MEDKPVAEKKEIEVLKTALLLERQGKAFYSKVAEDSQSPAVRNLFTIMAEEEEKHIEYLSKQFSAFSADAAFTDVEPAAATQSALKEILSSEVRQQISAASYEAAAVSAAMAMEDRAVKTYTARAQESDDHLEKRMYEWLAQWEQGHLRFLAEINDELLEDIWHQSNFWPF